MIQVGNTFQLTETPSTCIGSNSQRGLWRLWGGLWWLWRGVYQCMVLRFEVGSKQDSFQCEHSLLALLRWPITLHLRWFYLCIYMCVFLCVLLTCTCWFWDMLVCTIVAFFHFGLLMSYLHLIAFKILFNFLRVFSLLSHIFCCNIQFFLTICQISLNKLPFLLLDLCFV